MSGLMRGYGFLACLVGVLVLGFVVPELGGESSVLGAHVVGQAATVAIFAMMGLQVETRRLGEDLAEWKLHVLAQSATYVLLPALSLLILRLVGDFLPEGTGVGVLYLGILPTTISTAVVFTMRAGGNVPGAVFNCAVSNMLAVFLVPAWMAWCLGGRSGGRVDMMPVLLEVSMLVLVPLGVGQVVRVLIVRWVERRRRVLARVANGLILLLVFRAFASSAESGVWQRISVGGLGALAVVTLVLLCLAMGGVWRLSGMLSLSRPSRIVALFCGSQKSLASGVALAGAIFPYVPEVAVAPALLAVMIYHAAQLAVGGFLADAFAGQVRAVD